MRWCSAALLVLHFLQSLLSLPWNSTNVGGWKGVRTRTEGQTGREGPGGKLPEVFKERNERGEKVTECRVGWRTRDSKDRARGRWRRFRSAVGGGGSGGHYVNKHIDVLNKGPAEQWLPAG